MSRELVGAVIPTRSKVLFEGAVTVHAFGRETGNWRIGDFTKPENFGRVAELAQQFNVSRVWCPQASEFNAKIALTQEFPRSFGFRIIDQVNIMAGIKASGCQVGKDEGFFLSSADCHTMIARNAAGEVVCAHAGRDELIDRHWVQFGKHNPGRRFESVVDAVANHFGKEIRHLEIATAFGIQRGFSHPIDHSTHGEFNQKLRRYVDERWGTGILCFSHVNLLIKLLIRLQWLSRYGVTHYDMVEDGDCTRFDIGDEKNFLWHSQSREPDGKRNGIFVIVNK